MVCWGSESTPWVLLSASHGCVMTFDGLSPQTKKAMPMACFLVNTSGLSGGTYDAQDHKFGLSKLLAATWTAIVKRQLLVLLSPSGILPHHSPHGLILSKGNFLPCSVLVEFCHAPLPNLAWSQWNSVTLSHKFGINRMKLCHSVWHRPN